jgi:hypothetical protein
MILLAIALSIGMHAQEGTVTAVVAVPREQILSMTETDGLPDVIPEMPPCPDNFKLQRYRPQLPAAHTTAEFVPTPPPPTGWYDVDSGPHDGDYRCVRIKPEHALVMQDDGFGNCPPFSHWHERVESGGIASYLADRDMHISKDIDLDGLCHRDDTDAVIP